jgi:peptidoglycan/LPS O-acetylase OafA/YrhL
MVLAIILFTCAYDLTVSAKQWYFQEPLTSPIILNIPTLVASALMLQIFYKPAILVNYPIWSLSAEWVVNIFVVLAQMFTSKGRYLSLIFGAILICLSGAYESELMNQLGRALWGFSFGLCASAIQYSYSEKRPEEFIVCLLLIPVYFFTPKFGEFHSLVSVFPFAACILMLSQIITRSKISQVFSWAGRYSYGFYLWHFPMLSLSSFFLNQIQADPISISRVILELTLTSSLSILATKVSLVLFEEPIRRYWRRKLQLI